MDYPFDRIVAIDRITGLRVPAGTMTVYAESDIGRTTPLSPKDPTGQFLAGGKLIVNSESYVPDFVLEDVDRAVGVSGINEVVLVSTHGYKIAAETAAAAAQDAEASASQAAAAAGADAVAEVETRIAAGEFVGPQGKSAYQLAVDAGFVGPEAEWRESLRGLPGPDAIPADEAVATYATTPGTATAEALSATTASQIQTEVPPIAQQVAADYVASQPAVVDAAASAVDGALADATVVTGAFDGVSEAFGGFADENGNMSPFVWTEDGRLHEHSKDVIGKDAAGIEHTPNPDYITVALDDADNIIYAVKYDGSVIFPGLATDTGADFLATVEGGDVYTHNLTDGSRVKITSGAAITGEPSIVGGAVVFTADGILSWADAAGGTVYRASANTARWAGWGSSTMAGIGAELSTLATTHGATFYAGGVGGQSAEHILARQGARPARAGAVTIPASGPVNLPLQNIPSHFGAFSMNAVIAGIPGTLTKADGSFDNPFVFTRTTAGNATPIPNGTIVESPDGEAERGALTLLNIGKNNLNGVSGTTDVNLVFAWTVDSYEHATHLTKNVLVMGHFVDTNTAADDPERARILDYNKMLADRFGARYFDMQELVTSPDIWTATGITPTADDLAQQAAGNKPWSISSDEMHLNDAGEATLVDAIETKLTSLGWIAN